MGSSISQRRIFVQRLTKSNKYLESENFLKPIRIKSIFKEEKKVIKAFKEKNVLTTKEYNTLINEETKEPDRNILTTDEYDRPINEGGRGLDREIITADEYVRLIKKLEIASIQPNQRTNSRHYVFKK